MKILTIFAHPDDETMFAGGIIALLNRGGAQTHFLCATRGEGGELGEPAVSTRVDIHRARERELERAIEALGGGSLSFLGFQDPQIGDNEQLFPYTDDFKGLVDKIRSHIQQFEFEAVFTHGTNGEYGHPGHILTNKAVRAALKGIRNGAPLVYSFCADFPGHPRPRHANPDDPAHIILDITPVMGQKISAAYCHRSQHALFLRRRSRRAGYRLTVPEILLNVESLHRVHPPVISEPRDKIIQLLKPWRSKIYQTVRKLEGLSQ